MGFLDIAETRAVPHANASAEDLRLEGLLAMLPPERGTVLEIGARHGFVTKALAYHFDAVTALDLEKPGLQLDRVIAVQGDVRNLEFADNSFDCVVCSEVLEHVPEMAAAAREIIRVARHAILIGVPYRQDTRVGRTTCVHCGKVNPPYGHVNRFDENVLQQLFTGVNLQEFRYVSANRERTNALSAWLLDRSRNCWGAYDQKESCIQCGGVLEPPRSISRVERLCGALGIRLYHMQMRFNRPQATWIHALFRKTPVRMPEQTGS
jgi:SAM-dependent methyltransferase